MRPILVALVSVALGLSLCSCPRAEAPSAQAAARQPAAATRPDTSAPTTSAAAEALTPAERARRILQLTRRTIALAKAGSYAECQPLLEEILHLEPANHVAHYNMACVHSRLGRDDEALACLASAVKHGYSDFRHMERDPDLDGLRGLPGYRKLLDRNAEIQRARAEKIRAQLRRQFGPGYICEIDHANKLVFATNIDRQTLEELKAYLPAYARAMWEHLFTHRFEQYVTIVIPSSADATTRRVRAHGFYTHGQRLLVARQIGMVLTHEFTHALHAADQDGFGQRHAAWVLEGLATLFESSQVEAARVVPRPNHRLNLLKRLVARKRTIPWKQLFNYTHAGFMKRSAVAYPQARYIMMYLHEKHLLAKWYDAYVAGYHLDASGARAMEEVLGKPLDEIEADWLAWVRRRKAPPVRLMPSQAYIGVQVSGQTDGLRIRQVVPGSGAEKAGLRAGDVIVNIDGRRIVDLGALTQLVGSHKVGDRLEVRCRRDGEYRTFTVTLQPMPVRLPAPASQPLPATRPARKAG